MADYTLSLDLEMIGLDEAEKRILNLTEKAQRIILQCDTKSVDSVLKSFSKLSPEIQSKIVIDTRDFQVELNKAMKTFESKGSIFDGKGVIFGDLSNTKEIEGQLKSVKDKIDAILDNFFGDISPDTASIDEAFKLLRSKIEQQTEELNEAWRGYGDVSSHWMDDAFDRAGKLKALFKQIGSEISLDRWGDVDYSASFDNASNKISDIKDKFIDLRNTLNTVHADEGLDFSNIDDSIKLIETTEERLKQLKSDSEYWLNESIKSDHFSDYLDEELAESRKELEKFKSEYEELEAELNSTSGDKTQLLGDLNEKEEQIQRLRSHIKDLFEVSANNQNKLLSQEQITSLLSSLSTIAEKITDIHQAFVSIGEDGSASISRPFEQMRENLVTTKNLIDNIRDAMKDVNINFGVMMPEGHNKQSSIVNEKQYELANAYRNAGEFLANKYSIAANKFLSGGSEFQDLSGKSAADQVAYYEAALNDVVNRVNQDLAETRKYIREEIKQAQQEGNEKRVNALNKSLKESTFESIPQLLKDAGGDQYAKAIAGAKSAVTRQAEKEKSSLSSELTDLVKNGQQAETTIEQIGEVDLSKVVSQLDTIADKLETISKVVSENLHFNFDTKDLNQTGLLSDEDSELNTLPGTLQGITEAVLVKNQAFEAEGKIVNDVVNDELTNLGTLWGTILDLTEAVTGLGEVFKNIDADNLKSIKEIATSGADLKKLSNVLKEEKGNSEKPKTESSKKEKDEIDKLTEDYSSAIKKYYELQNKSVKNPLGEVDSTKQKEYLDIMTKSAEAIDKLKGTEFENDQRILDVLKQRNDYEKDYQNLLAKNAQKPEDKFKKDNSKLADTYALNLEKTVSKFSKEQNDAVNNVVSQYKAKVEELRNLSFIDEDTNKEKINGLKVEIDKLYKKIQTEAKKATEADDVSRTNFIKRTQDWISANSADKERASIAKQLLEEAQAGEVTNQRLKELTVTMNELEAASKAAGDGGISFGDRLKNKFKDVAVYFASFVSIQKAIDVAKQGFNIVREIDDAITELKKVSEASDQRIALNFDISTKSAKELNSTISDTIKATADWQRNGYNITDSEELARVSLLYKNVGDGIDVDTANESLISTLRGFEMEANQAIDIIDAFNEVANHMPIDTAGIGAALQRSAASFHTANTDLNESIALITATKLNFGWIYGNIY